MTGTANLPLIILAGGFGTRLRHLVRDVPKVLAPIGEQPFLFYLLQTYYRQGLRRIVLSLHFESEKIIAWLEQAHLPDDLDVQFVVETQPLGTGGAVRFVQEKLRLPGSLLICNGDTYLRTGVNDLLQVAEAARSSAMGLVTVPNSSRYGLVTVNAKGEVTEFLEKQPNPVPGWINSGLYYLTAPELPGLAAGPSIEKDFFPALVAKRGLRACCLNSMFIDIGTPDDYAAFCKMVQSGEVKNSWL